MDHGLGTFEKVEVWHDRNGIKRYRRSGYKGYNLHELRHTQATVLIGSGAGEVTPYGVVYDNGMKLEQQYDGQHFPA